MRGYLRLKFSEAYTAMGEMLLGGVLGCRKTN